MDAAAAGPRTGDPDHLAADALHLAEDELAVLHSLLHQGWQACLAECPSANS
ncbi:hypothetical protein [Streptomyces olivochromogenes]|uniref:hypothetical protein n=1 Tax=Streptomyces olivochromogenes TaxID=1963 RepID=UPI000AA2AC3E|nr:hypothetical protein [Streptomyces olivochromogenes]